MIGKLRHRITFQQNFPHRVKGEKVDAWGDVATVYARVEPVTGTEVIGAEQVEGRVTYKVSMRARPQLTEPLQFLDGTNVEYLDGELFTLNALTEPLQFLDGTDFTFLDGDEFLLLAGRDSPIAAFRIKFGSRILDISDVQMLYPHDEFTVLRAEEAL